MELRISCVQMAPGLAKPDENYAAAETLVRKTALEEHPDVILLPEMWNTSFFPEDVCKYADRDGAKTKALFGRLSAELGIHIVAGSVADMREGRIFNTSYVFDRTGKCIASYDKTHLFSPMGEDKTFAKGNALCLFTLDGVRCGVIICYDLRFPELVRAMALAGLDVLFLPAQWPRKRLEHLTALARARAIENQAFVALCNGCGTAGATRFGGGSMLIDPLGGTLAKTDGETATITATLELSMLAEVRAAIPVMTDRRPELYRI